MPKRQIAQAGLSGKGRRAAFAATLAILAGFMTEEARAASPPRAVGPPAKPTPSVSTNRNPQAQLESLSHYKLVVDGDRSTATDREFADADLDVEIAPRSGMSARISVHKPLLGRPILYAVSATSAVALSLSMEDQEWRLEGALKSGDKPIVPIDQTALTSNAPRVVVLADGTRLTLILHGQLGDPAAVRVALSNSQIGGSARLKLDAAIAKGDLAEVVKLNGTGPELMAALAASGAPVPAIMPPAERIGLIDVGGLAALGGYYDDGTPYFLISPQTMNLTLPPGTPTLKPPPPLPPMLDFKPLPPIPPEWLQK